MARQILGLGGNPIRYEDFIEQVMLKNGGIAPLKLLYQEKWNYIDKNSVKGKTPDLTIQERVQRLDKFTKIGLGVYALTYKINDLNNDHKTEPATVEEKKERKHATIQGMLIEIGNNKKEIANTYTNDKNWFFENKKLGNLTTIKFIPNFTYPNIIKDSVRFSDVIWFNDRGFPSHIYEVEYSTDFRDAFVKFMELQDFNTIFTCVSDKDRRNKFDLEIQKSSFKPIRDRVSFRTYEEIKAEYNHSLYKSIL